MAYQSIKDELTQHVIDLVNDGTINADNYEEAHYHAFNEDYYIVGSYKAEQWLKKHGLSAFEAVALVTDYEKDNFGEARTFDNAESTVNMLAYVLGTEVIPYSTDFEDFKEELGIDE